MRELIIVRIFELYKSCPEIWEGVETDYAAELNYFQSLTDEQLIVTFERVCCYYLDEEA